MKCRHLTVSEEAYRDGVPTAVFLCGWPTVNLLRSPPWVARQIGGGQMIDHKKECKVCSCFERQEATNG